MHRTIGVVVAAATIGLAACGGSSDAHSTVQAPSVTSAPTSVTSVPTPTTVASGAPASSKAPTTVVSSAPASSKAPTTAVSSAPASSKPPTAADRVAVTKAQVVDGFAAGFRAYEHCIVAPESCDFATASAEGSPLRSWLVQNVYEKLQYHLRARPGSGPMTFRVEGVNLGPRGTSASVTTCIVDGMVVYDVADPFNPDDDVVFNDRLVATRTSWTMTPTPVGWRRSAAHVVKEWVGKDRCS